MFKSSTVKSSTVKSLSVSTNIVQPIGLVTSDIILALYLNAVPVSERTVINYYGPLAGLVSLCNGEKHVKMGVLKEEIQELYYDKLSDVLSSLVFNEVSVAGDLRVLSVDLSNPYQFDATAYDAMYGAGTAQLAINNIFKQKRMHDCCFVDYHATTSISQSPDPKRLASASDEDGISPSRFSRIRRSLSSSFSSFNLGSPSSSSNASPSPSVRMMSFTFGSMGEGSSNTTTANSSRVSTRNNTPTTELEEDVNFRTTQVGTSAQAKVKNTSRKLGL